MKLWRGLAILLALPAGAALAVTDLGALSTTLPPAVAPGMGFSGDSAPGWRFAQAAFIDAGHRYPDPAMPSLHGYKASFTAPPLAVGTLAQVAAVPPRLPRFDEMIAALDPGHGGIDAAALGVFDLATAQDFTNRSVTLRGGAFGRQLTFKFAGQVGSSSDD